MGLFPTRFDRRFVNIIKNITVFLVPILGPILGPTFPLWDALFCSVGPEGTSVGPELQVPASGTAHGSRCGSGIHDSGRGWPTKGKFEFHQKSYLMVLVRVRRTIKPNNFMFFTFLMEPPFFWGKTTSGKPPFWVGPWPHGPIGPYRAL